MHQAKVDIKNLREIPSASAFFAVYVGPSMNPTLREPEILEIVPYGNRPVRVGDVVYLLPPGTDLPVVHRVIRVMAEGISTRGDNNTLEDAYLLQPGHVKGRVVAACRGRKRREVPGGFPGYCIGRTLRWRRFVDRSVSPLLHPMYHALSSRGRIARWLPGSFQPHVVVFKGKGQGEIRLLLRGRIIGHYNDRERQWRIRRPFRLLVDERALPVPSEP